MFGRGSGSKVIKSIPSKRGAKLGAIPVGEYARGDLGLDACADKGIASVSGEESVHGLSGSGVPTASLHSSVDVSLSELPCSDSFRTEYLPVDLGEVRPVVVGCMGVKRVAASSDSDKGFRVLSLICEGERVDIFWGLWESFDGDLGAGIGVGEFDGYPMKGVVDEYGEGTGMFHPGARSVRYHRPLRYTRFGVGGRVFVDPLVSGQYVPVVGIRGWKVWNIAGSRGGVPRARLLPIL